MAFANQNHQVKTVALENYPGFYLAVWKRICLYGKGSQRKQAWILFGAAVMFAIGFVGIQGFLNFWYKDFYDALQKYQENRFWGLILQFAGLASVLILFFMAREWCKSMLTLKWRRFMTKAYMHTWLSERNYYLLQLLGQETDNPDQRLAEDLSNFTTQTLLLFFQFLEAALLLGTFLLILWSISGPLVFQVWNIGVSIPGYLVWAALLYAIFGTLITKRTVSSLLPLDFQAEKKEGDFRYALVRVREHGESIAFYGGESQEEKTLGGRFSAIYQNQKTIITKMLGVNMWMSFYGQFAIILPILLMAPRFFGERLLLGVLMQVIQAFGQVEQAFSVIIRNYPQIIAWKASTLRILKFEESMKVLDQCTQETQIIRRVHEESTLWVSSLTLRTPKGERICSVENRGFQAGRSTLIQGKSGVGKSTFLRGISGVWPFGEGNVCFPKDASLFFVPQKSYLPLGRLIDVLTYPSDALKFERTQIQNLLHDVQLSHLILDLDQHAYWPGVLSGGEQQRLAFVRLMLHQPDWAFLDEATSALDEAAEAKLYGLLQKHCPHTTILSVGHRPSLETFHVDVWAFPGRE